MIIRHAEKPTGTQGSPTGVARDGTTANDSLTVTGWIRAGALAVLFVRPPSGLSTPRTLICPGYPDGRDHRVHETLEPLAAKLDLQIRTVGAPDTPQAAVDATLAAGPHPVLICWDHENIPAIASLLCTTPEVPDTWPDDRFDQVWILERPHGTQYTFSTTGQHLLGGDI